MGFFHTVTIQTGHAFFVVDIHSSPVLSSKFGIDPATVAKGTGFSLIPLYKLVTLYEAYAYSAYHRAFDVAVPTRGMTGSAGFLEYFLVEDLSLLARKPGGDPVFLSGRGVMQGGFISGCNGIMAVFADFQIIGRPRYQTGVSLLFRLSLLVSLMAETAPFVEMRVLTD